MSGTCSVWTPEDVAFLILLTTLSILAVIVLGTAIHLSLKDFLK